jgi:hypothetical protein
MIETPLTTAFSINIRTLPSAALDELNPLHKFRQNVANPFAEILHYCFSLQIR